MVNRYKENSRTKEEREITELDFGVTPQILHQEYLDVYERIQSEVVNTTRFDKNSDLSTFLGKSYKIRNDILRAEERSHFPLQNMVIHQADCWMEQNVNCY